MTLTNIPLRIIYVFLIASGFARTHAVAQSASAFTATVNYELESFEFVGSSRLTMEQVKDHLKIQDHMVMTDSWISESRTTLLGLGIFKDVIFSLRKGSRPGLAKLIIKAEDDDTVLSDWAVGGEFGLSLTDPTPALGDDSVFRGYRFGLIARNILRESHRAAMLWDLNSRGNLVYGQVAYGLPRFVKESIQFDSALTVVEPRERYFETESYGLKFQSLWTRQRGGVDVIYGASWFSNTHNRYRLEEWPDIVAGPKIGVIRETRFMGFFPRPGYRIAVAVIPNLLHRQDYVSESEIAGTLTPWDFAAITASAKAITTGHKAISTRAEGRLDIPLPSHEHGLRSMFYIAVRNGQDHFKDLKISGTETIAGFRYHSTGFIGDLSFRVVGERPWKNGSVGSDQ